MMVANFFMLLYGPPAFLNVSCGCKGGCGKVWMLETTLDHTPMRTAKVKVKTYTNIVDTMKITENL